MKQNILLTLGVILCYACNDPKLESRSYPSLDTNEVIDITSDGATLTGEVLALGSTSVKDHGFIYSSHQNSTLTSSEIISFGKELHEGKISGRADRNLTEGQYYYNTYAVTVDGLVVYGEEESFKSKGGKPPVLDNIIPSAGFPSDTVMLIGSGFSNVPSNNQISFGPDPGSVWKSNGDTIFCTVPIVAPGKLDIKASVGGISTSTKEFQVATPTFTSFTPEFVTFGDQVYLKGSNFPSKRTSMFVILMGRQALIVESTPTQLTVVIPDNITQAQSLVNFNLGSISINSDKTIKLNAPVIAGFSPPSGTPGMELGINGKNFNPIAKNNKVVIGGIEVPVLRGDNKNLYVNIPALAPGFYNIDVTTIGQKGSTSAPLQVQ